MSEQVNHPVLVVDFGAQYAQLIARRVREANIYSEVVPHTASIEEVRAKNPRALVLTGGPSSVNDEGAPALNPELLELGIPVFGICYGFQAMTRALGGTVAATGDREYGRTTMTSSVTASRAWAPTSPGSCRRWPRRSSRRRRCWPSWRGWTPCRRSSA